MEQAKDWMPDHMWEQMKADDMRAISLGQVENKAITIGRAQGMDAASTFLDNQVDDNGVPLFLEGERSRIFAAAQQASSQAVTTATTAAKEVFTQALSGDTPATIGDAARAAIAKNTGGNPDTAAAVEKTVREMQRAELLEREGHELASIESKKLEELQYSRKVYENQESDYEGLGPDYDRVMGRIDREIIQRLAQDKTGNEYLDFLKNRFGHEMYGSDVKSLEQLEAIKKDYDNRRGEFKDYGTLYKQFGDLIDDAIARKKPQAASGGGSSATANLEQAKYYRDQWMAGEMNGLTASGIILGLDIKADDRIDILSEMIAGKDGQFTQAAAAYKKWEQYREAGLAKLKEDSPEEKAYKTHTKEILTHLGQMRFTGEITPENMLKHVEEIIKTEETDLLTKANALRNPALARSMSLGGAFDYMSYNQYDEYRNAHPVMIGDSEILYNQLNAQETQHAMDILKANDWQIVSTNAEGKPQGFFEESEPGNRTGRVHFKVENGEGETATVRVGNGGKLERMETEDGRTRWVSFDKEIEAGKNATMARFETRIPDNEKAKIDEAIRRAQMNMRGSRAPDTLIGVLRTTITRELGNKAKTEEGKAYIEKLIEENFSSWLGR